ncbi:non-ribosomal peptide synthetase [Amycolatopsis sp. GM8]|uniref:non-ribosomal peptide synthetase n=1 Tax=Amycolatopsis sp. GM8 TaxID=2896530 RepID=UPI001F37D57B|nr:non-ribosomal peptide synthetase [Amycolatopsis sp. GM8]
MSSSQEALWFLTVLEPDSPFYNMPSGYLLRGELSVDALVRALADVTRRHAVLRSRIVDWDGEPGLIVDPAVDRWPLDVVDLGDLPAPRRDEELARLQESAASRPFDLAHDKLLRTTLVRLGPHDHVLLMTLHHVVADGWSVDSVLTPMLLERYHAHVEGGAAPVVEAPRQYWDFAAWQREMLAADGQRLADYWRESLHGVATVVEVPGDRPRPAAQTFRGAVCDLSFPAELTAGLAGIAKRARATLFTVALAAFSVLVSRTACVEDFVVGTPTAQGDRSEFGDVVGLFVNTLPLRTDLTGDPTFVELVRRVRGSVLNGLSHRNLPFDRIVDDLGVHRDLGRNPLVQVLFQLAAAPSAAELDGDDLFVGLVETPQSATRFDLEFNLWSAEDAGIRGHVSYATDLYDESTVLALIERFATMAAALAGSPDAPLSTLVGRVNSGPRPPLAGEPPAAEDLTGDGPATEAQRRVAQVWRDVLGRRADEPIPVTANFFHLGGNSRRAVQVVTRLRDVLGADLSVREFFQHPTVSALAAALSITETETETGTPAVRAGRGVYPRLSFSQERLWFLDKLVPDNTAYNLDVAFWLHGQLDVAALRKALARLVHRHEVLRTAFPVTADGVAWQSVTDWEPELARVDLTGLPAGQARAGALAGAAELVATPFQLRTGPLLRAALFAIAPDEHALVLAVHHAVCDGVSLGVVTDELARLYAGYAAGQDCPLPPPVLQFADFAASQRERLSGQRLHDGLAHWRSRLAGAEPLNLTTDRPRPAVHRLVGAVHEFALSAELTEALERLSRAEGTTLYMTLLAAFSVLLAKYSGQDDVVVASPVDSRPGAGDGGLVGFFVDTVPMRIDLADDPTFRDLLYRVKSTTLDALDHQDIPFDLIVADLGLERDTSRNPIAQVVFVYNDVAPEEMAFGSVRVQPFPVSNPATRFDLELHLRLADGALRGTLTYAADLFDERTIARMRRHLEILLTAVAGCPTRTLSETPLLDEAERRQVVEAFNDTAADLGGPATLHGLVAEQSRRTPDAVAVVWANGSATYRQLNHSADLLADRLRAAGVGTGDIVAVHAERSPELVVALLAALKAGAAFLPLSTEDPRERLAEVLADAEPAVVLTQFRLRDRLPDDVTVLDIDERVLADPGDRPREARTVDADAAYVLYTSGSTGSPNGVINTHAGIVNRLRWMQSAFPLRPDDVVLQKTPVTFDVSVWEFFWPLIAGARLVLAQPGGHRDPGYLREVIAREGVTTLHFVPSMLGVFLDTAGVGDACRSVRRVMSSGEALTPALVRRFHDVVGAELHNLYGPTEAAIDVTWWRCDPSVDLVPVGAPIANIKVYVLDQYRMPVPVGVPGELYLGGVGLGRGYLRRPELTVRRFVPDPFDPAGVLFRTGDRGRWREDGVLEFFGRLDDQVKLRGVRIELGEVEAALTAHPAVAAAAASVVDDRLVAHVVPDEETAGPVRRYLRVRADGVRQCVLPDGTAVFQLNDAETAYQYDEVFVRETYLRHGIALPEAPVVVDAGANIGLFMVYVHRHCRGAVVHAVEPMPGPCAVLRLNAELYGSTEVAQAALGAQRGEAEFTYYPGVSMLSGRHADAVGDRARMRAVALRTAGDDAPEPTALENVLDARTVAERIKVPVTTLSDLVVEHGIERIDLLKVDVERAEVDVLAGLSAAHWPRVRQVVAEVDGDERVDAVRKQLTEAGFVIEVEAAVEAGLHMVFAVRPDDPVIDGRRPDRVPASRERLAALLRADLARRVPSSVVPSAFVFVDQIPLTKNGKVDRRALVAAKPTETQRVTPRTPTEERVLRIWQELLDGPAGVTDDFFESGGHSLLAARLLTMLEREFELRLPLAEFLSSPTVAQLAALVEGHSEGGAKDSADCLVLLRSATSTEPAVLLCHALGGSILVYRDVLRRLPAGPAVFGLQAVGLADGAEPHDDVAAMAAHYADAVGTMVAGPVRPVGWSAGGVVALEVARLLAERGMQVYPPLLIDSYPVAEPTGTAQRAADFVSSVVGQHVPPPPSANVVEWIRETAGVTEDDSGALLRRWRVYDATASAVEAHRPRYAGPVTLLRPERPGRLDTGSDNGWSSHIDGPVEVCPVPGDHFSALDALPGTMR